MPVPYPMAAAPTFEPGADAPPRAIVSILREWPNGAARTAIVAVASFLFWLTWAHWGSIQIDCGRELYVPVQILHGKLLYRDLWYSYGPLEPYVLAFLLELFGQHLSVLYSFGLTLAIGCALLLYDMGAMLEGRAVGLTAALIFLLQGFGPPTSELQTFAPMFNYIFPWAYAATLGLLLGLLSVFFALRHIAETGHNLMLAGLAAGLALLCKQEFGVACYLMLAFVVLMEAAFNYSAARLIRSIAACIPGLVISIAIYGWFFAVLTPRFMFDNWFGQNRFFARTYAPHLYAIAGVRFNPAELAVLIPGAGVALFLWFQIAKASRAAAPGWHFVGAAILFALGMLSLREFSPQTVDLILAVLVFPRGMPFIGCAFLAYALYNLRNRSGRQRWLAEAALAVFALTLAIRALAQIAPIGYSIFYDGPILLVFVIVLARCIDAAGQSLAVEQRHKLLYSLLAAEIVILAIVLIPGPTQRTVALETSWGEIYLQPAEATVTRQIIDFVLEQKRQGRRVALLPELPIVYAFTGTEAPSRLYTLLPGFLAPSQEADYMADLRRADPAYIVLTNRNTREYGASYFGINYDRQIYRWIDANYHIGGQFGEFRRGGNRLLTALLYQGRIFSRTAGGSRPVTGQ